MGVATADAVALDAATAQSQADDGLPRSLRFLEAATLRFGEQFAVFEVAIQRHGAETACCFKKSSHIRRNCNNHCAHDVLVWLGYVPKGYP
ncbi:MULTISPECIES: hypothetical protein [Paraburkholderia]|uniref:Transposase n=1 Tax=Paraburkholderia tropica TaxID=92647 RepID=A0ABX5ML35_9BURK|nr:hypothetical protein [Paraburkholderia tropica]MBB2981073.1 hypothetical protein [Paraburkholderia tropica]MBB3002108.1 hypothetical protein [Paraburkholderia tropica]MBB6321491.1 hypothetical protein [Paraburkholderia tropica]MDE1138608.1 hypothetical protein [Paraburkholderia tropica]PXX14116.1 hypothetical protein C7400_11350 [Paraburkholderia tropica]